MGGGAKNGKPAQERDRSLDRSPVLAPSVIPAAVMLRLATVARKTSATGPFSLED